MVFPHTGDTEKGSVVVVCLHKRLRYQNLRLWRTRRLRLTTPGRGQRDRPGRRRWHSQQLSWQIRQVVRLTG